MDQADFLNLATLGKDAWNAWRRDAANKDVRVTFASIDFSEAPRDRIDFAGLEFGDDADFSGCKWQGAELATDPKAFRPGRAYFTGAVFGDSANFTGADFGSWASFSRATFGRKANFTGAFFGDGAIFTGTAYGWEAIFHDAIFKGWVAFDGKTEEQWATGLTRVYGNDTHAFMALKQRHEESWKRDGSGPGLFLMISFERARFDSEANFSGRSFQHTANFTNARFYYPPDFDRVANAVRIDFTGAHIGFVPSGNRAWTKDSQVPVRLRAFRKVAEDTKNHDLERDLYIEERKAERGVYLYQLLELDELKKKLAEINEQKNHAWLESRLRRRARTTHCLRILAKPNKIARLFTHLLWIAVMGIYWALADYGRSFPWPVVWLVSSGFFFYLCYTEVLAKLMAKAPDIVKYKQAVRMLALGNTVPFVGPLTIDTKVKEFLFCPCRNCPDPLIPPEGYQLLVVGQNLFSITCVFFIGLALRNYFRIK